MSKSRRKFTAEFKTRVALDALSGEQSLSELASKHGVHPNQISQWKQQAKEQIAAGFAGKSQKAQQMKPVSRSFMPRLANLLWRRIFYSKPSPKFELRAKA